MTGERFNYVVVGSFVMVVLAALIGAVAILAGRSGATETYYATYDNVMGLKYGTQVLYEGYQIGQIRSIEPENPEGRVKFKVALAVIEGWRIPSDSVAIITAPALLAAVTINIHGGKSMVMLSPGERIRGNTADSIVASMSNISEEFSTLSRTSLRPLIEELHRYVTILGETLVVRGAAVVANLDTVSADLAKKGPAITGAVAAFSDSLNTHVLGPTNLEHIDRTLAHIDQTGTGLLALSEELRTTRKKLDDVVAALGATVGDNRPVIDAGIADLRHTSRTVASHADAISQNLEDTSRDMREFSRALRQNPSLILRGAKSGQDPNP